MQLPSRLAGLARAQSEPYLYGDGQRGQGAGSQLNPVR